MYNSGHKENNPRYTLVYLGLFSLCPLESKDILWDHIYSVYLQDKQRHLFCTDLRSSHVHLDSLSKMRVKLAVQVLNSKVREDIENFENDLTSSTQKFILNCETLWNIFDDTVPLLSMTDTRIKKLENVLAFFINWKNELTNKFPLKSDISSHFISWQTFFDLQVTRYE